MDTVPYIRAAGLNVGSDNRSTAQCVQPDLDPTNPTPSFINNINNNNSLTLTDKYRKSYQQQPGLKLIHPALSTNNNNLNISNHHTYGIQTKPSVTVNDVLKSNNNNKNNSEYQTLIPDSLSSFINSHNESIYRTNNIAPIGQSYKRGFSLPDNETHRYGISSQKSESAKSLIYTDNHNSNNDTTFNNNNNDRKIPMSQISRPDEISVTKPFKRNYNWTSPNINPQSHTFGLINNEVDKSGKFVSDSLHHQHEEKETVIINNRIINHNLHSNYPIGQCKPIREKKLLELINDKEFRFGQKSEINSESVKDILHGSYTEQEQLPDKDLGISKTKLLNSLNNNDNNDRVYGVPSIRTDRSIPLNRSLSNQCNFGDEGSSHSLLFPSPYSLHGVNDEDFMKSRSPEYIEAIFLRMGIKFKSHQFQQFCSQASKLYGSLSLDSFRHVYNRAIIENRCTVCFALLCQHSECVDRPCKHDGENGLGNHRNFLTHQRIIKPLNQPTLNNNNQTLRANSR